MKKRAKFDRVLGKIINLKKDAYFLKYIFMFQSIILNLLSFTKILKFIGKGFFLIIRPFTLYTRQIKKTLIYYIRK